MAGNFASSNFSMTLRTLNRKRLTINPKPTESQSNRAERSRHKLLVSGPKSSTKISQLPLRLVIQGLYRL